MNYKNQNHPEYRFEYKRDHISISKYYNTTKKYACFTSILSRRDLTEQEFNDICEKWYTHKMAEEKAKLSNKKAG